MYSRHLFSYGGLSCHWKQSQSSVTATRFIRLNLVTELPSRLTRLIIVVMTFKQLFFLFQWKVPHYFTARRPSRLEQVVSTGLSSSWALIFSAVTCFGSRRFIFLDNFNTILSMYFQPFDQGFFAIGPIISCIWCQFNIEAIFNLFYVQLLSFISLKPILKLIYRRFDQLFGLFFGG